MNKLKVLQNDTEQREALKDFMNKTLNEVALTKLFNGESVTGFPEAKLIITTMFEKLDEDYGNN